MVTVDPNSAEKSFGRVRLCSAEKSKQLNDLSLPYTTHTTSRAESSQAAPRTSSCSVWGCSSRAMSRAIRLVARLVLICHFQIFGSACGAAPVVCGV